MKTKYLLVIILVISTVYCQKLSTDWAIFNRGVPYLEIYYSYPYNILHYNTKNDTVTAQYNVRLFLKNIEKPDSIIEVFSKRAIIPSFKNAEEHDIKFVDVIDYLAPAGRYLFKLSLEESLSVYSYTDTIIVPNFTEFPVLSSIELSTSITKDTTSSKFNKKGFKIIPNPELIFGQGYELAYVYFECYNLADDTFPYELVYQILDTNKSVIKSYPSEINKKNSTTAIHTFALSTKGLPAGSYIIKVMLKDFSNSSQTFTEKYFKITPKIQIQHNLSSYPSYIDTIYDAQEIRFFASPNQLKQYNSLSDAGKKEFLRKFWQNHNLFEFVKRLKYADARYGLGRILGRDTDRGKIYVKYGQPDEIVVHTMIEHIKPHEHWYYYASGIQYIFTDIHSNGNYQLIYSNNDAELNNPNWEKYIDPLESDDLR